MNQKTRSMAKTPRFSYLKPIQYLVVMKFGPNPVLSNKCFIHCPAEDMAKIIIF